MTKLSFIGMGNMAQALCSGFVKTGKLAADSIFAYAPNQEKLSANALKFGFTPCKSVVDAVEAADTIIMACKPYQIESVLKEIGDKLSGKAVISIALGWNFAKYSEFLAKDVRVQFVMPNTPAMVGEGVFLFEKSNSLSAEERKEIWELFAALGLVEELNDNLMGIGGAVTGCGPAFVDLFLEAYADAAVKYGIPRSTAYKLVSQTVLGSAKLQLETGEHPAVLKDNVCSPAGSTIRGVTALEENGLRNACIKSIDSIMNR
ncbi:MAG: pyrroline-5-carboxylate reductase [Treponema sp.]|nr:pyrroline-5-carboxylate reductase [Candidatus Treponema equifaecale]